MEDPQRYARAMWSWFLNEAEAMVLDQWGGDYTKTEHLKACGVDLSRSGLPDTDTFRKWAGTFGGTEHVRGIVAEHVYCRCGTVQERTVAREGEMSLSAVIQSILAYADAQGESD